MPAPTGPQIVYPEVLENTVYQTETGAKHLLEFTIADFQFCMDRMQDQRDGLDRRTAAMTQGMALLRQRKVATVKDLPRRDRESFADTWTKAVRP